MRNKDVKFLTEAYEAIREREYLKESNTFNTFINVGLANYFKKYLVEYTVGNKPPAGMTNVSMTGADTVNPYEPATPVQGTTTSGEPIEIHGTEREMNIEKAAIESTRVLLIFLTFARIDPIIRNWLSIFQLKDRNLSLTPEEQTELNTIERAIKKEAALNDTSYEVATNRYFWSLGTGEKQARVRYLELLRKREHPSNFEYAASEKDRTFAKEKILKRLQRLTKDLELKDELEDIVDFMVSFLGNNPNSLEMLDLPKYKKDDESPETNNQPTPGENTVLQALPAAIEIAIQIFGVGGAAVASTAAAGGYYLGKKAINLLKDLKNVPKKALALMLGNKVKPLQLSDKPKDKKEQDNVQWEIETSNGNFEPLSLEDKK